MASRTKSKPKTKTIGQRLAEKEAERQAAPVVEKDDRLVIIGVVLFAVVAVGLTLLMMFNG